MKTIEFDIPEKIKASVVKYLPLVNEIKDQDLREKVIEGWALSLNVNDFWKTPCSPRWASTAICSSPARSVTILANRMNTTPKNAPNGKPIPGKRDCPACVTQCTASTSP